MYVAATTLQAMMLEIVRMVAPTCIGLELHQLPGPYRWQNWRIGKLDVGCEEYGLARDEADELERLRHWIMVPDGHPLDGQIVGKEQAPLP